MKQKTTIMMLMLILFSIIPLTSFAAPSDVAINKIPSNNPVIDRLVLIEGNTASMSANLDNGQLIMHDNLHTQRQVRLNYIEMYKSLKGFNGNSVGYTHIADDGTTTHKIIDVGAVDNQGYISIEMTFSTVIIDGFTGYTTQTYSSVSGNQSFNVSNRTSYDLNITNNQPNMWNINGELLENRTLVTINGSQVTTESGIPLSRNIVLPGVNASGADVRLAYINDTPIAREIESVGVPSTDAVMIYYPFGTVVGNNSQFYVYWGNPDLTEPAADSTYGSQAVWDSNYVGVWHINNNPNGDVVGSIKDSTSNGHDGTPHGAMTSADLVNGQYGKGIDFDGSNDYIDFGDNDAFEGLSEQTLFIRAKVHAFGGNTPLIIKHGGVTGDPYLLRIPSGTSYNYYTYTSSQVTLGTSYTFNTEIEYDISGTWDGTNMYGYVDGSNIGSAGQTGTMSNTATPLRIGLYSGSYLNGVVYEARLEKISRSATYVSTIHKNLNNPTASGTDPFYLADGIIEYAEGAVNITASITGDTNTQSYNTTQSREFTLTPTGTTNNVNINTTSTDYDITITTYWTEDTVKYSESLDNGYANTIIQYTPSNNITSGILNSTYNLIDFSAHNYVGYMTTLVDGVNYDSNATRDGQNVNVSIVNFDTSTHWINFTVPYNPQIELYTPIDNAVLNYTFPPLNHDVLLEWSNTTGIYKYDVYQGAIIKRTGSTTTNSTTVSLPAGDYSWMAYGYDDIFNEYSIDSESFDFTISTNITYTNTTGVHGVVYDYLIGIESPLENVGIYIWNDTFSSSTITNADGYFTFTDLANSTYYLIAKKDRYYDSNTEVVTLTTNNMTEHDIRLIENTGTDYNKHYVKFILKSFFGTLYSDVLTNVYIGDSTTVFKTDTTGDDGSVTFELTQSQEYRFTFVDVAQSIDITKVITPSDTLYNIIVFGASIIPEPPASDDISYSVQGININTTYGYINTSFTDASGTTTGAEVLIKDKNTLDTLYQFNTTDSTKDWSQVVPAGNASYVVVFNIDNSILDDTLTITKTIYFDNEVNINLGLENNWSYILIAIIIITTIALLSSRLNAEIMGVITILTGWTMIFFGWLTAGVSVGGKITIWMMMLLATLIAFATVVKKGER